MKYAVSASGAIENSIQSFCPDYSFFLAAKDAAICASFFLITVKALPVKDYSG
jgi:hypothetical protein